MRLALAVLLCAASLQVLADEKGLRTENRTGSWWRTMETGEKNIYITGIRDGAILGAFYAVPKMDEKKWATCRAETMENFERRSRVLDDVTVADLVKELDALYADNDNATVMVPMAIFYLSRRTAGDSAQILRDMLAAFRKNDG